MNGGDRRGATVSKRTLPALSTANPLRHHPRKTREEAMAARSLKIATVLLGAACPSGSIKAAEHTPEELEKLYKEDEARWRQVIADAKIDKQ
jgi:hypothetical protein